MTILELQTIIKDKWAQLKQKATRKNVAIGSIVGGAILLTAILFIILHTKSAPQPVAETETRPQAAKNSLLGEPLSLTFAPPTLIVNATSLDNTGKADLLLYTSENRYFSEITFVLKYDPQMLTDVEVVKISEDYSPVAGATITRNLVDAETGIIEITYTNPLAVLARGGIATITFKPNGPLVNLLTTIQVTDQSFATLPNGERYPLKANDLSILFPDIASKR